MYSSSAPSSSSPAPGPTAPDDQLYKQLPKRYGTLDVKDPSVVDHRGRRRPFAHTFVKHAIETSESPHTNKGGIVKSTTDRVASDVALPLDNLPDEFRPSKHRSRPAKADARRKRLSATERRRMQLTAIPSGVAREYATYAPLHALWRAYMDDLVAGMADAALRAAAVAKADWHGAKVVVTRAKNPTLVGVSGIVVQESARTLKVVTEANRVVTVAKPGAQWMVVLGAWKYTVHGDQVTYRSADRAARKMKSRATVDMA
ncbi:RNase P/RNase MRP complex subunit [Allomyces javanicus]|nr:RNase P/RNase MRP complex subunit [Allomyces javanicus]